MPDTATSGPFGSSYKTILSLGMSTSRQTLSCRGTDGLPTDTISDGGGIRGYSSLMILEKLMGAIQKKLGLLAPPLPCECFDIIGGTSTGG
jgi:hypothetical protein